jgi:hypothetical protein
MEPKYVTFEQAKWLFEKDYPLTAKCFNEEGKECTVSIVVRRITDSTYYPRPEQHQVVEWASLVHNIDLEARPVRYAGDVKTSYYTSYINGCIVNMSKFATRQDALSEAINEFLKMI